MPPGTVGICDGVGASTGGRFGGGVGGPIRLAMGMVGWVLPRVGGEAVGVEGTVG